MNDFVYLDNNSTTALDAKVLEAMLPYMRNLYGNPSSSHHFGRVIGKTVDSAREKIAELIGAKTKEVIITSGATEAINLAIKGFALQPKNQKKHIITLQTEHKALLDTCAYLETLGFEVTYLPVKPDGVLDLEILAANVRADTFLIAVMYANNETGVLQDLKTIAEFANKNGICIMTDATQAVGKIPVNVLDLNVDLLALSAHKMYGPKGVGALYVKNSNPKLVPLMHGGGHEKGLRSGTLNVPGIVGLGEACALALKEMKTTEITVSGLRNSLEERLLQLPGSKVNGSTSQRLCNVTNICFDRLDANAFIAKNKFLAVSNGSACTSAVFEPSHVLLAMGRNEDEAFSSIRFSLGKFNTQEDIDTAVKFVETELAVSK